MKSEGYFVLLVSAALGAVAFAGCSSKDIADASSAGGGGHSSGTHASNSTGEPSVTASTGSGTEPNLGMACVEDADCQGDLKCARSDKDNPFFGGGPAGGYCTKDCTADADCP